MKTVIGVKFRNSCKVYTFDSGEEIIERGKSVIVETSRGTEMGMVMVSTREVEDEEVVQPLKPVIRIAQKEDFDLVRENKEKEKEAFRICKEKIREHGLEMKLVDVEYTFDGSKVLFYFTADGRIDFRELVKDLASVFRTRIELRQIGVRDETKTLGGMGICGRSLCCHSYLSDFVPVSIKMAKEQNLSLNPTKISGVCGRLMCCLKNEEETYEYLNSQLPKIGEMATVTAEGLEGEVQSVNVLRQKVKLLIKTTGDEIEAKEYHVDALDFGPERKRPVQGASPVRRFMDDEMNSPKSEKTAESVPRHARKNTGKEQENDRRKNDRLTRQENPNNELRTEGGQADQAAETSRKGNRSGGDAMKMERLNRKERTDNWQNERENRKERTDSWQNERENRKERTDNWQNERDSRKERMDGWQNERDSRKERTDNWHSERDIRQDRADSLQNEKGRRASRADGWQNERNSRKERNEAHFSENHPQEERSARTERGTGTEKAVKERSFRQEKNSRTAVTETTPGSEQTVKADKSGQLPRRSGFVRPERTPRSEHFEKTDRPNRRSYRPSRNRGQNQKQSGPEKAGK